MAQSHQPPPRVPRPDTETERRVREDQERQRRAIDEEEQTRRDAEEATAHLPKQGEPAVAPMTPQEALEALEDTNYVLMNFPEAVTLTLPGYQVVQFPAGVQEVPESLAEDEYLAASGVTPLQRQGARA